MPTLPGRAIPLGNIINRIPSARAEPVRAEPLQPVHHAEPTVNHHENIPHNPPVQAARAQHQAGADSGGNFKNKNPQNVMPHAG